MCIQYQFCIQLNQSQIMRVKNSFKDLSIYQNILKLFKQKGKDIPKETLYTFIFQSRRDALRKAAFINPLQEMMIQLIPTLIADKVISSRPKLLVSTGYLYSNLNIYSQALMAHIYQTFKGNVKNRIVNNEIKTDSLYRSFVQLNQYRYLTFLKEIRSGLVNKIVNQCSLNSLRYQKTASVQFLKKIEIIHMQIRVILQDKQTIFEEINPITDCLQKYFDQSFRLGLIDANQEEVTYLNTAAVFELYKVHNFTPKGYYKQFLQSIFLKYKKSSPNAQSNLIKYYDRNGQSVFQMRFQKSLHYHGYWFQRNTNIGLSQYDILIKGRRIKEYFPFQGRNLEDIKQGKWSKITKQQQQCFQKMLTVWHIPLLKKYKEDIVVNLNGPYHYTVGDKRQLVRSQTIKKDLLRIYGYNHYKSIDYKDWQRQINIVDTEQFFRKLTTI